MRCENYPRIGKEKTTEAVVICQVKVGFVVVMIAFNRHVRDQVDVGTAVGLMVPE